MTPIADVKDARPALGMDLQLIFELISAVGSVAGVVGLLLQLRDRHRAKAEQILIG